MLTSLKLENFKCFRNRRIQLKPTTIIVGENNAGKSTLIEALRLISIVSTRVDRLTFHEVPKWLDIPKRCVGVSPSLAGQNFNFKSLFHHYGKPPARIATEFSNGSSIDIFINGPEEIHAVLNDSKGRPANSRVQAKKLGLTKVGILPQIGPLSEEEVILDSSYVQRNLGTTLSSQHFRNQLRLLYSEYFEQFRQMAEDSWHGLVIKELQGVDDMIGNPLSLLVRNDDFTGEINWMGHGLQMWLQIMWFLARSQDNGCVILDEPDVYMHPDLQRRLIRLLRGKFAQLIVATHSVEIMDEVLPEEILVLERVTREANFSDSLPAVQVVIDQLGGVHNIQLARLWKSKKCLIVEGEDIKILREFQNLIFPNTTEPLQIIPNLQVEGWGGWTHAIGSSIGLTNTVHEKIRTYCLFDRDYHLDIEINDRLEQAKQRGIQLHIWSVKEIENFLLNPSVITRIVNAHTRNNKINEKRIETEINKIAEDLKEEVIFSIATEIHSGNRKLVAGDAARKAKKYVDTIWSEQSRRWGIIPGKEAISRLSAWTQQEFGVSLGSVKIARNFTAQEIPNEIRRTLNAIEKAIPLTQNEAT